MLIKTTKIFLENRKKIWIEKQTKGKNVKQDKLDKIKEQADRRYNYKDWLTKACKEARPSLTSHPSTFTNSDAKTTALIGNAQKECDGLLRTGNINLDQSCDVFGNASTDTIVFETGVFLNSRDSNGKTVFAHFKDNTDNSKELIKDVNLDYANVRNKFLSMFEAPIFFSTSHLLKQVYFPLKNEYHLISTLTSSLTLNEMRCRIDSSLFSDATKKARIDQKTASYNPDGFNNYFDLAVLGLGGTKPQNVSVLNSQNAGRFYILPSIPPSLKKRNLRLPIRDFFRDSLRIQSFQESFQSLHDLMMCPVNNMDIRNGIQNILNHIIDEILKVALKIREFGNAWSESEHYQHLSKNQKIWLDDLFKEQRENEEEWRNEISKDCARWLIRAYEFSLKEKSIKLGDDELGHIAQLVDECLEVNQEYFK